MNVINTYWRENIWNEQMFRTGIAPEEISGIAYKEDYLSTETILSNIIYAIEDYQWGKNSRITTEELREVFEKGPTALKAFFEQKGFQDFFRNTFIRKCGSRMRMLITLEENGITELHGKPIAEFLFPVATIKDIVAIAHRESSIVSA